MADATTFPAFMSARGLRSTSQQVVPGVFLLPVASIKLAERLRPVQQAAVDDLKVALEEGVLAHPVTVRPKGEAYELVIGAHRLTAFSQMGRSTIPVIIRDLTDLEARQLEIDENLVRAELNALDRLTFMAERIEVWAARNPSAVVLDASRPIKQRGRPPRNYIKLKQIDGFVPATMGFAAETAQDTGLSPASVYRAVVAVAGLPSDQRDRLHGSWIAKNDAALRQLATIGDAAEQIAVIDVLLAGKTKNIAEARATAAGTPIVTKVPVKTVQRDFERAWKAGTATERDAMLNWLSGQRLPAGWAVSNLTDEAGRG